MNEAVCEMFGPAPTTEQHMLALYRFVAGLLARADIEAEDYERAP